MDIYEGVKCFDVVVGAICEIFFDKVVKDPLVVRAILSQT